MSNFLHLDREIKIILVFLAISCVHRIGLAIAMVALLYFINQGVNGGIKALILIAIRTPLSSSVAVSFGALQNLKWVLIFGFCGFILVKSSVIAYERIRTYNTVLVWLTLFAIVAGLGSMMNASYPITALFKILSYYIVTFSIMRGVAATEYPKEYLGFFWELMTPLMIVCIPMVGMGRFRLVNSSFQGIFNHPNMMGIMGAIYIGMFVMYKKYYDRGSVWMLVATLGMIYATDSRTGLISAIFCIVLSYKYIFSTNMRKFAPLFLIGIMVLCMLKMPSIKSFVNSFLYKSGAESILYSREGQMMTFQEKFNAHKLLGSGFAVPYSEFIRDYRLNTQLKVEPGNIIWAVLGDCGIIGFLLFFIYILSMTLCEFDYRKIVFIAVPLVVSMGEMAFFSVNSIAMIYYLMFSLYLFIDKGKWEDSNELTYN